MLVEKVVKIPAYTFNFRMYPNKEQRELIDKIILEVHKVCNMAVYDMFTNKVNTVEKPDKNNKGETVHFPKISSMTKKEYLDKLRTERPSRENLRPEYMMEITHRNDGCLMVFWDRYQ